MNRNFKKLAPLYGTYSKTWPDYIDRAFSQISALRSDSRRNRMKDENTVTLIRAGGAKKFKETILNLSKPMNPLSEQNDE